MSDRNGLEKEISAALNRVSAENDSNTPDFILAEYLAGCLAAFSLATKRREKWYGTEHEPGYTRTLDPTTHLVERVEGDLDEAGPST